MGTGGGLRRLGSRKRPPRDQGCGRGPPRTRGRLRQWGPADQNVTLAAILAPSHPPALGLTITATETLLQCASHQSGAGRSDHRRGPGRGKRALPAAWLCLFSHRMWGERIGGVSHGARGRMCVSCQPRGTAAPLGWSMRPQMPRERDRICTSLPSNKWGQPLFFKPHDLHHGMTWRGRSLRG